MSAGRCSSLSSLIAGLWLLVQMKGTLWTLMFLIISNAQLLYHYPEDRAECPSNDVGCIVGTMDTAQIFPIRTVLRPIISTPSGTLIPDKPRSYWRPPVGYVHDYVGDAVARPAEYVQPSVYEMAEAGEDGGAASISRRYFTGLTAKVTVTSTGGFEPANIGVQAGTLVTWVLSTYEDVILNGTNINRGSSASTSSSAEAPFHLYSGLVNLNGGRALTNFSVLFGGSAEGTTPAADQYGPPEGLIEYENLMAWDTTFRRRDGMPRAEGEVIAPARGTVLIRPLNCSEITECMSCLLYDVCTWCAGDQTCLTRDPITNLPIDTLIVIRAAPLLVTAGMQARSYDLIRYYRPSPALALAWYPWPQQRAVPRPALQRDYPSGQVYPVSSQHCSAYANRTLGPKVCEAFVPPGPRERITGIETPNRPQLDAVLQCYNYVSGKYGRPPPPPTTPPDDFAAYRRPERRPMANPRTRPTSVGSSSSSIGGGAAEGGPAYGPAASAAPAAAQRRRLAESDVTGDGGSPLERSLHATDDPTGYETEYVGLSAPSAELAAAVRKRALVDVSGGSPGYVFRRRRRGAHDADHSQGVREEDEMQQPRGRASWVGHAWHDHAWHEQDQERQPQPTRRQMQQQGLFLMLSLEERAVLLTRPHWTLTVDEKVALVPAWQRRLLDPLEIGTPQAFALIQQRLAALYTDSRCNATSGCNLTFGRCLNTTGGNVNEYDQNGTCVCHHWFTGGDCSRVITTGGRCEYVAKGEEPRIEEYGTVALPLQECIDIRRTLYLCSRASSSDGLPRRCVDERLTALECLEAGYMTNATAAHARPRRANVASTGSSSSSGGGSSSGGSGSGSGSESSSNGGCSDPGRRAPECASSTAAGVRARGASNWLLREADTLRARGCAAFALEGTTNTLGLNCSQSSSSTSGSTAGAVSSGAAADSYMPRYRPNLVGHDEDGWAMALCSKCFGRSASGTSGVETMVRVCRRETSLRQCQRDEFKTDQNVCNMCSEDDLGSVWPTVAGISASEPCSLFRGTCPGSVEKRIRGVVPPNLDIVGHHFAGGLRYCGPRTTYTTSSHYYTEAHIMQPGQACINDEKIWPLWDWSKMKYIGSSTEVLDVSTSVPDPRTVRNELGLACLNPDDEATCPRSRRCEDMSLCWTDQPDWTSEAILQRGALTGARHGRFNLNLGWGSNAKRYVDPENVPFYIVPPEYMYQFETLGWAIVESMNDGSFWHQGVGGRTGS